MCAVAVAVANIALLSACDEQPASNAEREVTGSDPVIARALADPLMIDPDLAWVNEANAAISYHSNHALPAFDADPQAADNARDAARIEMREGGTIEELPAAQGLPESDALSGLLTLREILAAAGAPEPCGKGASDSLVWAAKMPDAASIMPHGMVQQAAGSDDEGCALRVVRYTTQTDVKDALQYHYTLASRAKLEVVYKSGTSDLIKGERAGEKVFADISDAPGGLRMVTLVHWTN